MKLVPKWRGYDLLVEFGNEGSVQVEDVVKFIKYLESSHGLEIAYSVLNRKEEWSEDE